MKPILLILFSIGLAFVLSACSSENASTESKEKENDQTAINLTKQIDGVFLAFIGKDTVKIEHDGEESVYLIEGKVTGDIDKVREGDNIAFSTKEVNGSLVLVSLRLR
jgi:PBP1b-binding outer membrane lipoprotein LpoB